MRLFFAMQDSLRTYSSLAHLAKQVFDLPAQARYTVGSVVTVRIDAVRKLVGIACFLPDAPFPYSFVLDGQIVQPRFSRSFCFVSKQEGKLQAHILWFPFSSSSQVLKVLDANGQCVPILHFGKELPWLEKKQLLAPHPPLREPFWVYLVSRLCSFAKIPQIIRFFGRKRYAGCWLFADRGFMADDNAEHMYRFMMQEHPEYTIVFALDKKSPDWHRLEQEGFVLVPIRSLAYLAAYLNCSWLLSSQRTGYITKHYWRKWHTDVVKHRFCFLQHGITMNYLPRLNTPHADIIVSSSHAEFQALKQDCRFPYVYSDREVRLTGLPRHDALLRKAEKTHPQKVIIMPSWRHTLATGQAGDGQFVFGEGFTSTEFFQRWNRLLQNSQLHDAVENAGFTLTFYPHPHLRPLLHYFAQKNVTTPRANESIQDLLAQGALLLTDYSSIAMEIAVVRRPVVYYQFDQKEFFNTNIKQGRGRGYFDYSQDGFGEVVTDEDALLALLIEYLNNGCQMKAYYKGRVEKFFPPNQGKNCQRLYEALQQAF